MSGAREEERRDEPGPIVVTGMHRSGTSMVAHALMLAGLHLGEEGDFIEPAPDNPRGFFEHAGFVELGEDLLGAAGGAWDHVPACPPMALDDPRVAGLRERAEELVAELSEVPGWGWKDPRACLAMRFWLDLLPDLRAVVCVRHPLEVALSLKRRNNTSYAHSLSLWHAYYEALLDATSSEQRIVTHYDNHFLEPTNEMARLVAFVGLPESAAESARQAKEEGLRHHRLRLSLEEAGVDRGTIELYVRLRAEAGMPEEGDGETQPVDAPAQIDRGVLDLAAAREGLERRARQVGSLERQRDQLEARVSDLESVSDGLSALNARVDSLEHEFHRFRYEREALDGWDDPAIVRGCRELVRDHVPRGQQVLVIAKGDPALLDLYGRPATNFPSDSSGRYPGFPFDHGLAAIGHLEAQCLRGGRFLLIPETAVWWLEHFSQFASHLADRHRLVADQPGVGLLIELNDDAAVASTVCSVQSAIETLVRGADAEPTVLDWTSHDLASRLPGYNAFAPPPGERLPYLEGTVDVVLIDGAEPDATSTNGSGPDPVLAEATRVAAHGVVAVTGGRLLFARATRLGEGPDSGSDPRSQRITLVLNASEPDPGWLAHLRAAAGHDFEIAPGENTWSDLAKNGAAAAVIEEGVLPLPGCWEAARRVLESDDEIGAVATKLLAADGSIEAAGATIFADGSVAGVAAGSHRTVAPWHEYVRDTSGAAGLIFFRAEVLERLAEAEVPLAGGTAAAWAAALWELGFRVVYQPEAVAVRAAAPLREPASAAQVTQTWASALKERPPRPDQLDEAEWRALLAREEIGASV